MFDYLLHEIPNTDGERKKEAKRHLGSETVRNMTNVALLLRFRALLRQREVQVVMTVLGEKVGPKVSHYWAFLKDKTMI